MSKTAIKSGFLSEQAVSDRHGVGISILRVLGEDLEQFDLFARLTGSKEADQPAVPALRDRTVNLPQRCYHPLVQRVGRKLNLDGFDSDNGLRRRYAEQAAERLARRYDLDGSVWLTVPQGPATLHAIRRLKEIADIRYATWMMDDHELSGCPGRWEYPWMPEDVMRRHLEESDQVFVGSDHYGRFYQERFGVDSTTLLAPYDSSAQPVWENPVTDDRPNLAYFGSVFGWQLDPLEILARCAAAGAIKLDIYSFSNELPPSLTLSGVTLKGPLEADRVLEAMRQYSAVVIPLSFGDRRAYMSHFNVPTKVAECLASGTVTLVLGPEGGATVELVRANGVGLVVIEQDPNRVAEELEVLQNAKWRRDTLAVAWDFVKENLTEARMRQTWREGWNRARTPKIH